MSQEKFPGKTAMTQTCLERWHSGLGTALAADRSQKAYLLRKSSLKQANI